MLEIINFRKKIKVFIKLVFCVKYGTFFKLIFYGVGLENEANFRHPSKSTLYFNFLTKH